MDASRPVAERVMKKGHSIMVLPGGEREQLMTEHGKEVSQTRKSTELHRCPPLSNHPRYTITLILPRP